MRTFISIYLSLVLVFSLLFNSCTYYYSRKGLNEDLKGHDWKSIELERLNKLKISSPIKYYTVEGLSQEGLYMGSENSRLSGEAQSEIRQENILIRVNSRDVSINMIKEFIDTCLLANNPEFVIVNFNLIENSDNTTMNI